MENVDLKNETPTDANNVLGVIISNGYIQEGYGYKKVTEENTHWITLFGDNLQMYAYFTEDNECEKIYDTGIIEVSVDELQTLIRVLNHNHA
jgi:hypothetical protein